VKFRAVLKSSRYRRWFWNKLWAWRWRDPGYDEFLRLERIEALSVVQGRRWLPPLRSMEDNLIWMRKYFAEPDLTWKRILKDWSFYFGALITWIDAANEKVKQHDRSG